MACKEVCYCVDAETRCQLDLDLEDLFKVFGFYSRFSIEFWLVLELPVAELQQAQEIYPEGWEWALAIHKLVSKTYVAYLRQVRFRNYVFLANNPIVFEFVSSQLTGIYVIKENQENNNVLYSFIRF